MNLAAKIYLTCLGIAVLVFAMFPAEDTYTTEVYPTEIRETVRETNTIKTIEQSERLTLIANETERLEREVKETKALAASVGNDLQMEAQARVVSSATAQGALSLAATVSNDLSALGQEVAAIKGQLAEYEARTEGTVAAADARIAELGERLASLSKSLSDADKSLRIYVDEQNRILLGHIDDVKGRLGRSITWVSIGVICLGIGGLLMLGLWIRASRRR
ncbi:MAG: hypothetical protein WC565_09915 [Parcubacteria group bacterium]|jgi:DNA repair exonuclease SbcCD ATPase subunit